MFLLPAFCFWLVRLCCVVQAILQIPLIEMGGGGGKQNSFRGSAQDPLFCGSCCLIYCNQLHPRDFCLAQLGLRIECPALWLPTCCFLAADIDTLKGNMLTYSILLAWDWKDLVTLGSPSPSQCGIIPSRVFLRLFNSWCGIASSLSPFERLSARSYY